MREEEGGRVEPGRRASYPPGDIGLEGDADMGRCGSGILEPGCELGRRPAEGRRASLSPPRSNLNVAGIGSRHP